MGEPAEQRVCERATLRRPVELVAGDGGVIPGVLVNVSLGGALVEVVADTAGFTRGQSIGLRLVPDADGLAYACVVTRATDDLLGLSLDRKLAAKFGLAVTRGMFARGQSIGAAAGA